MLKLLEGRSPDLHRDEAPTRGRVKLWILEGIALLLLLLIVLALQYRSGAYTSELSNPDEPAHFISALLVRDYIASGFHQAPMDFAREYYAHYPKVAIGNWPPGFYAVQGVWLLLLPAKPASMLILLALITSLLAWLVFRILQPTVGTAHAALGAGLLVLLYPVLEQTGRVMIEMMLALTSGIAVWLCIAFLDRRRLRDAALFGLASVLAVLTKGNALFILLVPPIAILIGRRWAVLRTPALWAAVAIVLLVAGTWMWYFLSGATTGWLDVTPSTAFVAEAAATYASTLVHTIGYFGVAMVGVGMWGQLRPRATGASDNSLWVCAAALIIAVFLFHVLVPAGIEGRHLIPAYPAVIAFLAAGAHRTTLALHRRGLSRTAVTALVIGTLAAAFMVQAFRMPAKALAGYRTAAELVIARTQGEPSTSLIVSTAVGEGAFIAEIAARDPNRPTHTVWRGTNLLSSSTWAGRDYNLRSKDDDGVLPWLEQASVRMIVIDRTPTRFHHQTQLFRVIAAHPDRFILISDLPVRRGDKIVADGIAVYEFDARSHPSRKPEIRQVPAYQAVEVIAGDRQ